MCRSPMAAALLRVRLEEAEVPAEMRSAGHLTEGRAAAREAVRAMADLGIDLSGHRSRRTTPQDLRWADLVLGMERDHVRRAVVAEPSAWPRTYTIRELVRRGELVGPRRPDEPLGDWLDRAHEGRSTRALIDPAPEDDLADPMGGPPRAFAHTAAELAHLVDRLVRLGLAPSSSVAAGRPRD